MTGGIKSLVQMSHTDSYFRVGKVTVFPEVDRLCHVHDILSETKRYCHNFSPTLRTKSHV